VRDNILVVVGDQGRKLFLHDAHQFGSMRVAWMEEGTGDKVYTEVVDRVSLLTESQKSRFTRMVIG
jgi:hypothetical protein